MSCSQMLVSSVAVAAPMAERSARTKITQDRVLLGPRLLVNAGIAAAATEAQQSVAKSSWVSMHRRDIRDRPHNFLANPAESSMGPCGSELIDDLAVRIEKRNTGRSVGGDL